MNSKNPLDVQIGGNHYKTMVIQPVEFSTVNKLGFLEGSVVKRMARHNKSTGKGLEDIDKAIHELQLLRKLTYGVGDESDVARQQPAVEPIPTLRDPFMGGQIRAFNIEQLQNNGAEES